MELCMYVCDWAYCSTTGQAVHSLTQGEALGKLGKLMKEIIRTVSCELYRYNEWIPTAHCIVERPCACKYVTHQCFVEWRKY